MHKYFQKKIDVKLFSEKLFVERCFQKKNVMEKHFQKKNSENYLYGINYFSEKNMLILFTPYSTGWNITPHTQIIKSVTHDANSPDCLTVGLHVNAFLQP